MTIDERDFKKQFEDYEVTPSPGLWDAIERRMIRRRGVLWLILFGMFGISAVGGYWGWEQLNQTASKIQNNVEQELIINVDSLNDNHKILASITDSFIDYSDVDETSLISKTGQNKPEKREKGEKPHVDQDEKNKANDQHKFAHNITKNAEGDFSSSLSLLNLMKMNSFDDAITLSPNIPSAPVIDSPDYWVDSLADSLFKDENSRDQKVENNRWRWGVHLLPQMSHALYQSDDVSGDFLSKIENAEGVGKGFSGEVNLYYKIGKKFEMISGVWYTFNQRNFKYEAESNAKQPVNHPTSGQDGFNSNPSPGVPPDTSDNETKVFEHKNQSFRIGIPLFLRYQFLKVEDWQFFATTGFQANYLHDLDQHLIGREGNVVYKINEDDNDVIRKFNVQYNLRLSLEYAISDKWSIAATPNLKASLFSDYKSRHFLERHNMQFGVGVGFIKDF